MCSQATKHIGIAGAAKDAPAPAAPGVSRCNSSESVASAASSDRPEAPAAPAPPLAGRPASRVMPPLILTQCAASAERHDGKTAGSAIPKGLCPPAQGCRVREATLG